MVDHGRVIRRHELSDVEWEFVRPLLTEALRGRKRLDDRMVLNGIVWKFRTGTAWRDVRTAGSSPCLQSPADSFLIAHAAGLGDTSAVSAVQ
jgi:transposase